MLKEEREKRKHGRIPAIPSRQVFKKKKKERKKNTGSSKIYSLVFLAEGGKLRDGKDKYVGRAIVMMNLAAR